MALPCPFLALFHLLIPGLPGPLCIPILSLLSLCARGSGCSRSVCE